MKTADPITNLINAFARLPGIGERTASRLAFFVLNQPPDLAEELAAALTQVKERVGLCARCCNLTEGRLCSICASPKRDHDTVCVVESVQDLRAVENTNEYQGAYHVLHGLISPLEGVGPDDIHVTELLHRLRGAPQSGDGDEEDGVESGGGEQAPPEVEEIIVATSPSVDGEATALYISKLVKPLGVRVTRIASGVPIGTDLEYTDKVTLSRAMAERREI
jgi:recombination protein RecR